MRERDRLSLRAHREAVEAEERAERERREAPIREAESKLKETHRKLAEVMRARLLGEVKDPDRIPVDNSVASIKMTKRQADEFNLSEFRRYFWANRHVYFDQQLAERMVKYFDKNGLQIVTAGMIGSLIERYRDAGLLPEPPEPEPCPEPEPQPEQIEAPKPDVYEGWDLESGEPRTYTKREVDHMSADEYRRAFRIYREHLNLPNIGPGPMGILR